MKVTLVNCVGFFNYKYFLLLLLYAGLSCLLISSTYWETVVHVASDPTTPFARLYLFFVSYMLGVVLAVILNSFFIFHVFWLILPNYTTIEFCEKKRDHSSVYSSYSPFNHGCKANFTEILGSNCFLWLLPFCTLFLFTLDLDPRPPVTGIEFKYNSRYRLEYLQD